MAFMLTIGILIHIEVTFTHNLNEIFTLFYTNELWKQNESVSGHGSDLLATQVLRKELPKLFKRLRIKTLLDAPCGDFWWMKETDLSMLDTYIGADIVQELIAKNNKLYGSNKKRFICLNIVDDTIPYADCILCRDCLVHLTFEQINKALKNFKKSGSKYLLLTTFPHTEKNKDIVAAGDWRKLNFQVAPFNFPQPLTLIYEGDFDKYLALWDLDNLNL